MNLELLPYALLLCSVTLGILGFVKSSSIIVIAALAAGVFSGVVQPLGVVSVVLLLLSLWLPTLKVPMPVRWITYGLFLTLAFAMSQHLAPGFNNFKVFDRVQFSSDSIPFTMYLNFDKVSVGLALLLIFLRPDKNRFERRHVSIALNHLLVLTVLLGVLAPLSGYVRFDLKAPDLSWIWILNNFFFVCLAEEALFRGFIQGGLQRLLPETRMSSIVAIGIGATLFGLAHFRGGLSYVLLAFIAGLFYGSAFAKSRTIQTPMLVHFGLNTIHFFVFSYPALVR